MSEKFVPPTPPVGVIESLTQGFETVSGHLLLLLLPLLLDIAIWAGPRVSYEPLLLNLENSSLMEEASASGITSQMMLEMVKIVEESKKSSIQMIRDTFQGEFTRYFPIQPFMTVPILEYPGIPPMSLIGVPSLLSGDISRPLPLEYIPPTINIASFSDLLKLASISKMLSLVLGTMYLILIAQYMRAEAPPLRQQSSRYLLVLLQFLVFGIGASLALIFVLLPFLILSVGLSPLPPIGGGVTLAGMVLMTGSVVVLWVSMFIIFTVHSMLLHDRNLLTAVWDSVRVIQWNMLPTMILFLLVLTLNWGLMFIWKLADTSSWLAVLAIGGHAFISTGLIAATYAFYRDRYRYWKEMREVLLAELARRQNEQGGMNKST